MLDQLGLDLRYALRVLRKERGFTLVAVSILALGIGGAVTMFGVIEATLLRALPYPNASRVVAVWESREKSGLGLGPASGPNFLDWRRQNTVFDAMAAFTIGDANLSGLDRPERLRVASTSAVLFDVLGMPPAHGRAFRPEEEEPSASNVAVISDRLWRSRFGGDPNAPGRTIRLDGTPHIIVGVMPPGFDFPADVDVWVPLVMGFWAQPDMRASHNFSVVARLRNDMPLERARSEMSTIAARLTETYPESNEGRTISLVPLREELVGDTRIALLSAFAAVLAVLIIACANIANLLFTRAAGRRAEIMVRVALGAGRDRIIRQFLVESLVLAVTAGALGVLLAWWGTRGIAAIAPQVAALAAARNLEMSPLAVVFALGVSFATALSFGLAPAMSVSRPDISHSLREGGRGMTEGRRVRDLRAGLTVAQIALSLALLVGAGLLLQSFRGLERERLGFQVRGRVALDLSLAGSAYATDAQRAMRYRQLMERVNAIPGVEAAALTPQLPLDPGPTQHNSFEIEGRAPAQSSEDVPGAYQRPVTGAFFETMGIPLVAGRAFSNADDERAPLVAIIDSAALQRYWPNENPVGKRIHYYRGTRLTLTIIGVAGSVKHDRTKPTWSPTIYVPLAQFPWSDMTIVARTSLAPEAVAEAIARVVRSVDPELPVSNVRRLEDVAAAAVWRPRFASLLLGAFATIGLMLAGLGIYGIMSHDVARRTREMALRIALGAGEGDVSRLILRRSAALAAVGMVLGLGLSVAGGRIIARLLYGVEPLDPSVYATAIVVLGMVVVLASAVPARRAATIAPGEVLRGE